MGFVATVKRTLQDFLEDDCPSMAAALAYYTIFSLPPLLVIVITVAGALFGRVAVQGRLDEQVSGLIGPSAAEQVRTMIAKASVSSSGLLATALGIAALVFAATTAFAQLQASLNRVWEVKPDPARSEVKDFFFKRVLSFGMILAVGFLLVVSLAVSAALSAWGYLMTTYMPRFLSSGTAQVANFVLSLAVFAGLFGSIYRVLPDARVEWRDALTGATFTSLLFSGGKHLLGIYLGNSNVLTPYGAAGSLALILLWTYYSSMIVLMGAEFTQVWATSHGRIVAPEHGAVRIVREERRVEPSGVR